MSSKFKQGQQVLVPATIIHVYNDGRPEYASLQLQLRDGQGLQSNQGNVLAIEPEGLGAFLRPFIEELRPIPPEVKEESEQGQGDSETDPNSGEETDSNSNQKAAEESPDASESGEPEATKKGRGKAKAE